MDEDGLANGLEQLIELARSVETTSRVFAARRMYLETHGVVPNHIVVSRQTYLQLIIEAQTLMSSFTFFDKAKDDMHIFGMSVELAPLPDGEFFVGEKQ